MSDENLAASSTRPTSERLADDLEAKGWTELAQKAREGLYDDFKSPLAFPTSQLVKDLRSVHDDAMIALVKDGAYDASPEEAELWRSSDEGRAAFDALVQPPTTTTPGPPPTDN